MDRNWVFLPKQMPHYYLNKYRAVFITFQILGECDAGIVIYLFRQNAICVRNDCYYYAIIVTYGEVALLCALNNRWILNDAYVNTVNGIQFWK